MSFKLKKKKKQYCDTREIKERRDGGFFFFFSKEEDCSSALEQLPWPFLAHLEQTTCCEVSMCYPRRGRWYTAAAAGFWMKLFPFWVLGFVQNSCREDEKSWERLPNFLPEHCWGLQGLLLSLCYGHTPRQWSNSATSVFISWSQSLLHLAPGDGEIVWEVVGKALWFLSVCPSCQQHSVQHERRKRPSAGQPLPPATWPGPSTHKTFTLSSAKEATRIATVPFRSRWCLSGKDWMLCAFHPPSSAVVTLR